MSPFCSIAVLGKNRFFKWAVVLMPIFTGSDRLQGRTAAFFSICYSCLQVDTLAQFDSGFESVSITAATHSLWLYLTQPL
jgi:hypothetical protein